VAWIRTIDEDDAQGELRELYERLTEPWGGVDNILKVHSLSPASLRGHFELYKTLMRGPSPLTRAQREMIAVAVSAANRCHY
jgi:uncharacterized peroxidase-related enzyme